MYKHKWHENQQNLGRTLQSQLFLLDVWGISSIEVNGECAHIWLVDFVLVRLILPETSELN